jgi:glycosyltransferase involved in cell wall biosynthesis
VTPTWCGIPVYNNAATIADVARRCREQIAHVVVVDDGSTDANLRELLKGLDVAVIRHPSNLGKGAALLTAFQYAASHGAEYLITLDGDGQHLPEDLPKFVCRLSPDVILLGSRDEIVGKMPQSSRFGREFSDFWICVETGAKVVDSQSGFRAYPLKRVLSLPLESKHYNLEVEILSRAVWAGLEVQSVPIRVWYPEPSKRISSFHPIRDNFRISILHARLVLRQFLPIPHRALAENSKSSRANGERFRHLLRENASALGLSTAAALAVFLSIVLWPWGFVPLFYIAWRLHLNKMLVAAIYLLCLVPALPEFCLRIGRAIVQTEARPHLAWFIGSHIMALIATPAVALLVYAAVRRRAGTRLCSETGK